jgi:hypothetical protein
VFGNGIDSDRPGAQVRAGHSSVTVALDVYSHATDGMQREAAERIDNVLTPFQKL